MQFQQSTLVLYLLSPLTCQARLITCSAMDRIFCPHLQLNHLMKTWCVTSSWCVTSWLIDWLFHELIYLFIYYLFFIFCDFYLFINRLIDSLLIDECRSFRQRQVRVVPTSGCVIYWLCRCSVYSSIICYSRSVTSLSVLKYHLLLKVFHVFECTQVSSVTQGLSRLWVYSSIICY